MTGEEPLDCRCTDEISDAACTDHGLLAFLRGAIAAEEARDSAADEGNQS